MAHTVCLKKKKKHKLSKQRAGTMNTMNKVCNEKKRVRLKAPSTQRSKRSIKESQSRTLACWPVSDPTGHSHARYSSR